MEAEDLSFNGQRKGEKIEEIIKNHPFVLFWPGLKMIFFFALGIATLVYFPSQYSGMVLVICVLIGLAFFLRRFYDYSQSVFLITNQRLINVFQDGFLKRKITETDLNKVQDASSSTSGLFKTMLKFGDLTLRTAGASKGEEIIVKNIPNPYDIQQRIANIK